MYTDQKLHDVGSKGRYDRAGEFDTPTLIKCWRTAAYMHDGQCMTIQRLLNEGKHGHVAGDVEGLTDQEINDLAEFVLSLQGTLGEADSSMGFGKTRLPFGPMPWILLAAVTAVGAAERPQDGSAATPNVDLPLIAHWSFDEVSGNSVPTPAVTAGTPICRPRRRWSAAAGCSATP